MRHLPNIITIARLCLVPCFLVASMRQRYTLACVLFVTAAVTDVLDGWLARRLNVRSRVGALLDPAADKTLMVCGFVYYTFARHLPNLAIPAWLTFAVFIRDFLIAVTAYLMYTRVSIKRFPPSVPGKISTVLQAVTLAFVVAVNSFLPGLAKPVEVLFRISLLMTLFSGWGYLRRASLMLKDDGAVQA
jgi:cardiolipin synthase (CMP-forming)